MERFTNAQLHRIAEWCVERDIIPDRVTESEVPLRAALWVLSIVIIMTFIRLKKSANDELLNTS